MANENLSAARELLREAIPQMLCEVMRHYRHCFADGSPEAVKELNAYNQAGKNAIAHMQLLLRLHDLLGASDADAAALQDEIDAVTRDLENEDA
jgi:hypothetical protein